MIAAGNSEITDAHPLRWISHSSCTGEDEVAVRVTGLSISVRTKLAERSCEHRLMYFFGNKRFSTEWPTKPSLATPAAFPQPLAFQVL